MCVFFRVALAAQNNHFIESQYHSEPYKGSFTDINIFFFSKTLSHADKMLYQAGKLDFLHI